jgi:probable HAF family extracellular repeat protein
MHRRQTQSVFAFSVAAAAWPAFAQTPSAAIIDDIGAGGAVASFAYDIDQSGTVVGSIRDGAIAKPFRWSSDSGLVVLPSLSTIAPAAATAIAEDGIVYGHGMNQRTDYTPGAIFWSGGVPLELDLPSPFVGAVVLDAAAGLRFVGQRLGPRGIIGEQAFRLNGGIQQILSGSQSGATGVLGGLVSGWEREPTGLVQGRLWDAGGSASPLQPAINGAWAYANAIGSIPELRMVGASDTPLGLTAAYWDDAALPATPIVIPGAERSIAHDINSGGDIVGMAETDTARFAFWWSQADGPIDLNTLLAPADRALWNLTQARAINDAGQIAGFGIYTPPGGSPEIRAFRLSLIETQPCPADVFTDGVLNVNDVITFVNAFQAQDPIADISGDGMFNVNDVIEFVNAFNAGCP